MARQLKERPCKTLQLETWQSGLTPVLRRPIEPATQSGHSSLACTQSKHLEKIDGTGPIDRVVVLITIDTGGAAVLPLNYTRRSRVGH